MDGERERRAPRAHVEDKWMLMIALGLAGALAVGFGACGAGPVDPAEDPRPRDEPVGLTAHPPAQHGDDVPALDAAPSASDGSESAPRDPKPAGSGGPRP